MHFNDVTLDGLMKEFQKLAETSDAADDTYVLPKDLLDNPQVATEVSYYDDLIKTTASEHAKLYDVMNDSKLVDEAHPKGSTKLEGISDPEATVEDLRAMHEAFEKLLSEKVKVKSAILAKKLTVLANKLDASGHANLATLIDEQLNKLAEVIPPPAELAGGFDQMGVVSAMKESVDNMLRQIEFRHYGALTPEQRKQFVYVKANAVSYLKSLEESIQKQDQKTGVQVYNLFNRDINPFFMAVAKLPDIAESAKQYMNTYANLAKALGIRSGEHNKSGVSGQIVKIINMFDQKLREKFGAQYTGTPHTWAGLDAALRKYFNLYPSNVKDVPAGSYTYSNWDQLARHVNFALAELDKDPATEHNKTVDDGTFHMPEKGPPVSPDLPGRTTSEGPKIRTPHNYMNPN